MPTLLQFLASIGVRMTASQRAQLHAFETGRASPIPIPEASASRPIVHVPTGEELVTVCDHCLREACWEGDSYCDAYRTAGTVQILKAFAK